MSKILAKPPVMQTNSKRIHIYGLNGLRALAVIFVVCYHYFPQYVPGGLIGVDIFFVISGYLITALLIAELQHRGAIQFKNFWLRRIRRLIPALVLMISFCAAIATLSNTNANSGLGPQLLGALTYTSNWVHILTGHDYFQHDAPELFTNLWSVAVEEQFYFFWPIVLVLITVLLRKWKARGFAASVLALASVLLMVFSYAPEADSARVYYGTDTHAFGLMLGATIAFWNPNSLLTASGAWQPAYSTKWDRRISGARRAFDLQGLNALASLLILTFFAFTLNEKQRLLYGLGLFTVSLLSAKIIDALIATAPGNLTLLLHKILGNKKLVWLGERSYGIYLWHWPLYVVLFYLFPGYGKNPAALISTMALSVFTAALSYRFLEVPIRRYGFRRFFNRTIARAFGPTSRISRRLGVLTASILCVLSVAVTAFGTFTAPPEHSTAAKITANKKILEQQHQLEKIDPAPQKMDIRAPAAADIVVIGDSVVLGSAPEINKVYPEAYIDASVSRSFSEGVRIIERMLAAGTLRPVIVFALATNGVVTDEMVNSLLSAAGAERQVLLVTAYADRPWVAPTNQALRKSTDSHPNVKIADWHKAVTAHPDWLAPDGIHPEAAGATLYAEVIKAGIESFAAESQGRQLQDTDTTMGQQP